MCCLPKGYRHISNIERDSFLKDGIINKSSVQGNVFGVEHWVAEFYECDQIHIQNKQLATHPTSDCTEIMDSFLHCSKCNASCTCIRSILSCLGDSKVFQMELETEEELMFWQMPVFMLCCPWMLGVTY